eukprot:366566-Chlamydomonas_euryale.AAC.11
MALSFQQLEEVHGQPDVAEWRTCLWTCKPRDTCCQHTAAATSKQPYQRWRGCLLVAAATC